LTDDRLDDGHLIKVHAVSLRLRESLRQHAKKVA